MNGNQTISFSTYLPPLYSSLLDLVSVNMKRPSKFFLFCLNHSLNNSNHFFVTCYLREEHLRYVYLLRRYLEIKYPTIAEAKESFSQLMNHIEEMRQLNADIMFFFRSYAQLLQTSPLFTQLLDLGNGQSAKPSPHQNTDPFGVPVFDDPSMYSLPEVNQQQQQLDGNNMTRTASVSSAASSSTTSSSAPQQHQYAPVQSSYGHSGSQMDNNNSAGVPLMNTTTSTYSVDNSANQQASSTTSSTSSASTASSNAYRECIINSAH